MNKNRVFVSSVQKELENERIAVASFISTDSFLQNHCIPVLYEFEPASPNKALEGCLNALDSCDIFSIIWREYGHKEGLLSITHHEYRRAKQKGMPILIYIKGHAEIQRAPETQNLIREIQDDGYKYKRFGNYLELQREVRASLVKLHKEKYAIEPSSDENKIAEQTFEAASDFETQSLKRIRIEEMELGIARQLIANAEQKNPQDLGKSEIVHHLLLRGLIWTEINTGAHYGTTAGIMLFAHDPSAVFPQCRFLADAYKGQEPDGDPSDHVDIRGPIATSIEKIITFIEKNTRHPIRVVGLNRVRLDEYPVEALREALVNAAAHRVYEDVGRKTMIEVFSDRIVISSPGLPPAPLTL